MHHKMQRGYCWKSFLVSALLSTLAAGFTGAEHISTDCKKNTGPYVYACPNGEDKPYTCIPWDWVGDGKVDCQGSYTEEDFAWEYCENVPGYVPCYNISSPQKPKKRACYQRIRTCSGKEIKRCKNKGLVDPTKGKHCEHYQNQTYECGEMGHRKKCKLRPGKRSFYMQSGCIPEQDICDGVKHCTLEETGKSDEDCGWKSKQGKCSSISAVRCDVNQKCWNRAKHECDGKADCPSGLKEIDPEDEPGCDAKHCKNHLKYFRPFHCLQSNGKGLCYGRKQQCNGKPECSDKKDEHNCKKWECRYHELYGYCDKQKEKCVKRRVDCDGKEDCLDSGEDEDEKICRKKCKRGMLKPRQLYCPWDTKCIKGKRCNGVKDCKDGSDEKRCKKCVGKAKYCKGDDGDNICAVPCDGYSQCADHSDELGCPKGHQWNCKTVAGTIPIEKLCDGIEDCTLRTDEKNCPPKTQSTENAEEPNEGEGPYVNPNSEGEQPNGITSGEGETTTTGGVHSRYGHWMAVNTACSVLLLALMI